MVEICITRITTAIRETESIEKHAKALVGLWDSCLEHSLRPSGRDEDAPHAKIASDVMSCILQVCPWSIASCLMPGECTVSNQESVFLYPLDAIKRHHDPLAANPAGW